MRSGLMTLTDGAPVSVKTLRQCKKKEDQTVCENLLKLFGSSGADTDSTLGPTRVSFADCSLDEEWKKKALDHHWVFSEVKSENSIDRIKGTAKDPRFSERVPSGAEFKFKVTLKQLSPDEKGLENFLLEGLKLLEMDALGGSGSRGYGRIQFKFNPELQKIFDDIKPL
jgi:CRISPR-associated protein Csm3